LFIPDPDPDFLSIPDPVSRGSVVDPYSFFPDQDPEFDVGDQYGSRALMTKNLKKITAENFILFFFDQKLQFTYP
jgi:hypothetical protein